jgi:hypothetical protein
VFDYNHSDAYVTQVMTLAQSLGQTHSQTIAAGTTGGIAAPGEQCDDRPDLVVDDRSDPRAAPIAPHRAVAADGLTQGLDPWLWPRNWLVAAIRETTRRAISETHQTRRHARSPSIAEGVCAVASQLR